MKRQILTVLGTEFTDHSRDRRSIFAAFMYALFGPVLVVALLSVIAARIDGERTVRLDVYGAEHAPTLVARLAGPGVEVTPRAGSLDGVPDLGASDVVLVIPATYRDRYQAGAPADLILYRDDRRESSTDAARSIARRIQAHAGDVAQARLIARGVAPELTTPVRLLEANVAAASMATLQIATMLLYFFVAAPFFTSMSMAIDATAGERERRSLAPLLAQPIHPAAVILGKWANAAVFGILGTVVTVVLGMALMRQAPLDALQLSIPLDLMTQLRMILVLIPLALAASALQIVLALMAKTFKEAQTYMTLLSFAPVILGFAGSFGGREPEGWALLMPVLGQIELLRGLIADGAMDPARIAGVSLVCIAVAALALTQATRLLRSERILGGA